MKLFTDPQDLDAYGHKLGQFLVIGGFQLETLAEKYHRVTFNAWAQAVRMESARRGMEIAPEQLRWLWNALKSEPATSSSFGHLMEASDDSPPVRVLPKGSRFVIKLSRITVGFDPPTYDPSLRRKPSAEVILEEDLYMKGGKKNHLECKPGKARLRMWIYSDIGTKLEEAAKMKVKPNAVTIIGDEVTVMVTSLNQAYHKASLRLEADRLSHGGRSYDALTWVGPQDKQILLGRIREQVENGEWKVPDSTPGDEEKGDDP